MPPRGGRAVRKAGRRQRSHRQLRLNKQPPCDSWPVIAVHGRWADQTSSSEYERFGIRVNTVSPGWIPTEMTERISDPNSVVAQHFAKLSPMERCESIHIYLPWMTLHYLRALAHPLTRALAWGTDSEIASTSCFSSLIARKLHQRRGPARRRWHVSGANHAAFHFTNRTCSESELLYLILLSPNVSP